MLFGVENPIVDLRIHGDWELVTKYGLNFGQAILANSSHEELFEHALSCESLKVKLGGTVLTSLRIA